MHGDPESVPERAHLLERFNLFERRRGQIRKSREKIVSVGVEPDVAKRLSIPLDIALTLSRLP